MAVEDRIMRDMLSNENILEEETLVPMPGTAGTKLVAPGVDVEAQKSMGKRWGTDTPMFNSKDDMHGFLQDLGMAPGGLGADFLDAALYMSEGEFQDALISLGAAVPILGMGATAMRRGKKGYDYAGRAKQIREAHSGYRIDPTTGRKVRVGVKERNRVAKFKEDLNKKMNEYEDEHFYRKGGVGRKIIDQKPLTSHEKKIAEEWEKSFSRRTDTSEKEDLLKSYRELRKIGI